MSITPQTEIPTTGTWEIDPVHSTVTFTVRHLNVTTFRGHFHAVSGALTDGTLAGEVATDNLDVGIVAMFKEHLMAEDWFDVANHEKLSFQTNDLSVQADGAVQGQGELTIKTTTQVTPFSGAMQGPEEVTRPDGKNEQRMGLNLTAMINRRDFGIVGGGGAGDDVSVEVSLALVLQ